MKEKIGTLMEKKRSSQQFDPSPVTGAGAWPMTLGISAAPKAPDSGGAPVSSALRRQGSYGQNWQGQERRGSGRGQLERAGAKAAAAASVLATDNYSLSQKSGVSHEGNAGKDVVDQVRPSEIASGSGPMDIDETARTSPNLATTGVSQDHSSGLASTHRGHQPVHLNLNLPPEEEVNLRQEEEVETVVYEGWGYPLEDAWMYARRTRSRVVVEQDSWKVSQESMSGVSTKLQQDASKSPQESTPRGSAELQSVTTSSQLQAADPVVRPSPSSSMVAAIYPAVDTRTQSQSLSLSTSSMQRGAEHPGPSTQGSRLHAEHSGLSLQCSGLQDEHPKASNQIGNKDDLSFQNKVGMWPESKISSPNVDDSLNANAESEKHDSKKSKSTLGQYSKKSSSSSEQHNKKKLSSVSQVASTSGGTHDQDELRWMPKNLANDNGEDIQPLNPEGFGQPSHPLAQNHSESIDPLYLPQNHSVDEAKVPEAVWAKTGEKWEAGIRCCPADCPTVTLKSKPHYSKRKYFLIYFPAGGHWSWVDNTHTCSISKRPVPLHGDGTHESCRETVKDLNLPRRRILLKLGAEMLDISDRLHIKAVTEASRDVKVWKKFAEDAAHATDYPQLGSLLVRLHLAIGQQYIKLGWMARRHQSWKVECFKASTARTVDKLTKELINAVRWDVVSPFWNEAEQPELDPAWSNWKGDAFDEVFDEKATNGGDEDEDRIPTPLASDNETLGRGSAGGGRGAKRFKQQARAKRPSGVRSDSIRVQPSQQNDCRVLALSSESHREEIESTNVPFLASVAVRTSPQRQEKEGRLVVLSSVARNSGLCTAYLRLKGRRCIRQANPGTRYCGKHKHLTGSGNGGMDRAQGLGQAWESGLCSACVGLDSVRCEHPTVGGGSLFCQLHASLFDGQNIKDEDENVLLSTFLRDPRCKGITNRGCQCTHKPKGSSPYCEKHILQEGSDKQHGLVVAVGESSSHKRLKLLQDKSRVEIPEISRASTFDHVNSGRGGAHHVPSVGNGSVNKSVRTPGPGFDTPTNSRKRKGRGPNVSADDSAHDPTGQGLPGNKEELRPRCIGRIARDDSQCSFKARAGNHYLCTKHLHTAENHMNARGLQRGSDPQGAAEALLGKYMKAAVDLPGGEEGAQKRRDLLRWTKCQASQDVYCAEKLLTLANEEVARLQKVLLETQSKPAEFDSQGLGPSEDRSIVEFRTQDVPTSGDNRFVESGSTLIWPSLVEGRFVQLGRTGPDPSEDKTVMEGDTQEMANSNVEQIHLLEYVKEAEGSTPARCGLCDLIFMARGNLCTHWKDCHKKETSRLVKGYSCRSCRRLYSRKQMVQKHWKKRHPLEAQIPKSKRWSAVCAGCDSAFGSYDEVLDHVCAEHPDRLTAEALKEASVLGRIDIPVEIAMGDNLVCKECNRKFASHWDHFHHIRSTHKTAELQVEGTSVLNNTREPTPAGGQTTPAGQIASTTAAGALGSQAVLSELRGCRVCGEKFSCLSDLQFHKENAHVVCKAGASSLDIEPTGRSSVQCARTTPGTLCSKGEPSEKIFVSEKSIGGMPAKRKLSKQSEEDEKAVPEEEGGKVEDFEKGTLLLKMKTAVHTAQVRNIKLSKRGEGSGLRPRKALYSLTKGGQMFQDYDATIIADDNDLLDMAQSACCQKKLLGILGQKYGTVPPEKLLKRTIEVCNASNVKLEWFSGSCSCSAIGKVVDSGDSAVDPGVRDSALPPAGVDVSGLSRRGGDLFVKHDISSEQRVKVDGSASSSTFTFQRGQSSPSVLSKFDAVIVTSDLSRGQEPVPVACLVDKDVLAYLEKMKLPVSSPEDSFIYITERVLDPSLGLDPENYKVGCSCQGSQCAPKSCDHVHIFDNDNVDALDIYGKEMKGRFPYDGKGCIILEEGYLVYECNSSCSCDKHCANRVLQKGVNVRLEVFKTFQKGWAVKAAQDIPRGTFVCEYLGEVLRDQDANKRGETYDKVGCSYLYDIDAHLDVTGKVGRAKPFVIDATKHGNVARFINHSCAPNLINYQVLVDSMDYQLAHIGLFASRDIKKGEELAYDYRYRLLPGKGCPCHCGAPNCRGRLY